MGSFPYSSLAPPTTDERAAVTDSISIATAGFKENFLRVVFLFYIDILIQKGFVSASKKRVNFLTRINYFTLPLDFLLGVSGY